VWAKSAHYLPISAWTAPESVNFSKRTTQMFNTVVMRTRTWEESHDAASSFSFVPENRLGPLGPSRRSTWTPKWRATWRTRRRRVWATAIGLSNGGASTSESSPRSPSSPPRQLNRNREVLTTPPAPTSNYSLMHPSRIGHLIGAHEDNRANLFALVDTVGCGMGEYILFHWNAGLEGVVRIVHL